MGNGSIESWWNTELTLYDSLCFFCVLSPSVKVKLGSYVLFSTKKGFNLGFQKLKTRRLHRTKVVVHFAMFSENLLIGDLIATTLSGGIALSILRFWEETAKRGVFDQVFYLSLLWILFCFSLLFSRTNLYYLVVNTPVYD